MPTLSSESRSVSMPTSPAGGAEAPPARFGLPATPSKSPGRLFDASSKTRGHVDPVAFFERHDCAFDFRLLTHRPLERLDLAFAEMGIQGEPVGAEKVQEMIAACGVKPEDNVFSRGIIEMREE